MREGRTLAALLVVPAGFAAGGLLPGSWLWGVDALRYLGALGWASFGLAVAATIWLWLGRIGGEGRPGQRARGSALLWLLAAAMALVALALPDRLHFVGDSLLRLRAAEFDAPPGALFPQALPLDVALHWSLPRLLGEWLGMTPAWAHRALGAVAAVGLAAAAVAFVRAGGWRGAAALAALAIVCSGGALTLFTGLGKSFAEMAVLTLAIAAAGLSVVRDGRRRFLLGALLATALLTHRSALALVPGAVAALLSAPARAGARDRPSRSGALLESLPALALPAAALTFVAPQLVESFRAVDAANFGWRSAPGRSTFYDPLHLLDLTQCALWYVPAAALLAWRPAVRRERAEAARERRFLAFFALPSLLLAVLYLPPQGLFRDYDGLSVAGMALAAVLAHHLGSRLARDRPGPALGIALWCALPSLWLVVLAHLPERGVRRVGTLALGPPARPVLTRGHTWDFLGSYYFDAGQFAKSASALEQAAQSAPSPRVLSSWAEAARRADDWPQAERAYALLLERAPETPPRYRVLAHLGLASAAGRRGDLAAARHHLEAILRLEPGHPDALRMLEGMRTLSAGRTGPEEAAP